MSRWKKILLILAAVVLLLPAMLMMFVVATETGLKTVTGILARIGHIGPVTLQIEDASGTMWRGVHIGHISIRHRYAEIEARDITGQVELLPLLARHINVNEVDVGELDVVMLRPPPRVGPRGRPRFLPPLMRVDLESAKLRRGSITAVNGTRYTATDLHASATIQSRVIRVREAGLTLPEMNTRMRATGRVRSRIPVALDGNVEIDFAPPEQPAWHIVSTFDGNLDELPLELTLDAPFHATSAGALHTLNAGWRYTGSASIQDFDLATFGGSDALGLISGTVELEADSTGYRARGQLNPAGLEAGPLDVQFDGVYRKRELQIRSASFLHPPSRTQVSTAGTVTLQQGGGQMVQLQGEWQDFRWPLTETEPAFTSPRGRYTLAGNKPWNVTLDGDVLVAELPVMPMRLTGVLEPERFVITKADVTALRGQAVLTGEASWKPAERWQVSGSARGLDPSAMRRDLPGKLDFEFEASGAPFGGEGSLDVAVKNLRGRLRGMDARGGGRLTRSAGNTDLRFGNVNLTLGTTRLQLDGRLGTGSRELNFVAEADDLSLLDPEARGTLRARGRYAGTDAAPVLNVTASGSGFEWKGRRLDTLRADVDLDLGTGARTQGEVRIEGLYMLGREVQEARLTMSGTPSAQKLELAVGALPLTVRLDAQGSYAQGTWQGAVQSVTAEGDRDLRLRLEKPAPLTFSTSTLSLGELCMVGAESARFCGSGESDPSAWRGRFAASQLPLAALTAGLAYEIAYYGTINLDAEIQGAPNVKTTGEFHARLEEAELRHRLTNGREERMALGNGRVDALATPTSLGISVSLDAGNSGLIRGSLNAQRSDADWITYPIEGSLDLSTDGLGVLDIYLGGIDRAQGRLTTKVNIGGTLGTPKIDGLLQLRDARIDVYQVNLSLRELSMDAKFNANTLDLTGSSLVGDGRMSFSGNMAWRDREPYGELKISGENLRVADVPEATIEASPNLDFKITGRRVDATGKVLLPRVRLEPADLTNAALASSDEVMVGTPPVDPSRQWTVVSDIRVELGENVHMDAFGLTARLGGGLNVRTDEYQITRGLGELTVVDGDYSALGRKLDVTRGRLLYNNVPLGDPGVDLRAEKEFPDVTAGVNVRGSLRAPRLTFYSEPSIPQRQIASLILAGGSMDSVQNTEGAGRNYLLAQGAGILAQQYGSKVGIEDVALESDLDNDTSLVLGKYLSPRLYVSYGISLAEAINTFKLRYTLGDNWTLKTEAGLAKSADIEYTIRR